MTIVPASTQTGGILLLEKPAPAPPDPSPPSSTVLHALDTSSHQGTNITALIDQYTPDMVVVRAYQSIELSGQGDRFTLAQARTAGGRGLVVPFYGWVYAGDGRSQAADVLDTVRRAPVPRPPFVAADVETYTDGSYPTIATVLAFLEEIERQGYRPVVYTGKFMWDNYYKRDTTLSHYPLWDANYAIAPTFSNPGYGGWTSRAGHQYTSTPVDRSIFRPEFASSTP